MQTHEESGIKTRLLTSDNQSINLDRVDFGINLAEYNGFNIESNQTDSPAAKQTSVNFGSVEENTLSGLSHSHRRRSVKPQTEQQPRFEPRARSLPPQPMIVEER